MKIPFRGIVKNVFHLSAGEALARLCNVTIVVWLGRGYGVTLLGVYALAQTLTQYLQPLIDFGLRHVGARLLARYPEAGRDVVARVQRRRMAMAVLVLPFILAYSRFARLPGDMKNFLFVFAAIGVLYALSLEWAAWGQGQMQVVGLARAAVPIGILAFLVLGRPHSDRLPPYLAAGNAFGFLLQAALFRCWWKRQCQGGEARTPWGEVQESLSWGQASILGVANLCGLAFSTVDMLLLGLLSNPVEVGLYGAAYRVLNQVIAAYALLMIAIYPRLARLHSADRTRVIGAPILVPLAGAGIAIAALLALASRPILTLAFGRQFAPAAPLLFLLAWSIPFDFLTSYLSSAFIAWGMGKEILIANAIGALSNMVLNIVFIPSLGARGAALNTLFSYALFLTTLGMVGTRARQRASCEDQAGCFPAGAARSANGPPTPAEPSEDQPADTTGCDVSVVIPAYHSSGTIQRALDSVFGQSLPPREVIVVDDGSRDWERTRLIAQSYPESIPLRFIHLNSNRGVSTARNTGVAAARGRYVAFLDADDIWFPHKLAVQYEVMTQNRLDFTMHVYRDDLAESLPGDETLTRKPLSPPPISRLTSWTPLVRNDNTSTVMVRRATMIPYDPSLRRGEDFKLYMTLLAQSGCRAAYVRHALSGAFKRSIGVSGLSQDVGAMHLGRIAALRKLIAERRISAWQYAFGVSTETLKYPVRKLRVWSRARLAISRRRLDWPLTKY